MVNMGLAVTQTREVQEAIGLGSFDMIRIIPIRYPSKGSWFNDG